MELADLQAYAGKRVCVAVSGGVDSVCLLHCFLRAAESLHIALSALTCEHGIRGAHSVADCEFVKELCNDWNVPLAVFSADIPARAKASGRGLEEEGRNFRYECFAKVLGGGSADAVATAHHRDDFAETVLFRLARGTSLAGLSAIRERNGIIRPFLSVSRAQIEEYAGFYGLPFVTDESNSDETYARNAIRLSVMPALERAVNGAAEHLTEFALRAAEDDRYLQSLARREVVRDGNVYLIPVDLPAPLFSRACLYAVRQLGCEKNYTGANVKEISCLKELQSGKKACLPRGLCAVREGDRIAVFDPEPPEEAELPFCEGDFALNGYSCAVSVCAAEGALRADYDAFPQGTVIRTRRSGDVFTPFKGRKKPLKEYLTDRKIPAREGWKIPLAAKGNEVYAIFGVEISDKVKVTDGTKKAVALICRKKTGEPV